MRSPPKKSALNRETRGTRRRVPRSPGRQRRSKSPQSTLEILETLLMRRMQISLSGEATHVSAAEAIMLQLMQKAMAGNARAWQAILKYQKFADQRSSKATELKFEDSDYTRAFAKSFGNKDDG